MDKVVSTASTLKGPSVRHKQQNDQVWQFADKLPFTFAESLAFKQQFDFFARNLANFTRKLSILTCFTTYFILEIQPISGDPELKQLPCLRFGDDATFFISLFSTKRPSCIFTMLASRHFWAKCKVVNLKKPLQINFCTIATTTFVPKNRLCVICYTL